MRNYRETLRLLSLGYTQRQVASSLHCSRNTVRDIIYAAEKQGVKWPLDESFTNEYLDGLFNPVSPKKKGARKEPDYSYVHNELAKSGVNLSLLWNEYCTNCYNTGETPYMYTQFCEKYRKWARLTKATMRIKHKPGDTMQVDWAGSTLSISDPAGHVETVYIFVAVLPCSGYSYVEACTDMKLESWLTCHVNAFTYFKGVPRIIIPDNLKTGVARNTRYETIINRSYQELAEHYDTAIVPARVERPKDKGSVEGTVKYVSTWIIAALRNQKFFTIEEVRQAVKEKLEEFNAFPFKKREGNRKSTYLSEEKDFMKQLPVLPYEPAVWSTAKVPLDYLISDGKNKYSVPFDLIGEKVDIRLTDKMVEVFFRGSRVALHQRKNVSIKEPVINSDHMPEEHRKYLSYNPADIVLWARSIGESTLTVAKWFLESGKEPEQGFKSCASLIRLEKKHGGRKLETACMMILKYASKPSIRAISVALKTEVNATQNASSIISENLNRYGITRGAAYYSKEVE